MPETIPAGTAPPEPPALPGGRPGLPPPPPMMAGPTAPATVAPDSQGMRMRGIILAIIALDALDKAAGFLGSKSEEGQALMQALVKLRKTFGSASADLRRQEVKMLGQEAGPVSMPTPAQGAAFQNMIRGRLQGMGVGGPTGGLPPAIP